MKKEKKRKETWQDGKCVDLQLQLQLHCVASNNHGRWLLRAVLTGPGRSSTQIDGEICWRGAFCRQGGMQPEPCWEGKPAAAVSFVRVSLSASEPPVMPATGHCHLTKQNNSAKKQRDDAAPQDCNLFFPVQVNQNRTLTPAVTFYKTTERTG